MTRWLIADCLPMPNPLDLEASHAVKDFRLPPGHFVQSELDDLTPEATDYEGFQSIEGGQWLYLIGVVKYIDAGENWRRTGFCRRWDPDHNHFAVVDHPDYEYEE